MAGRSSAGGRRTWIVVGLALLMAGLALHLLLRGGGGEGRPRERSAASAPLDAPALDEHDARSRAAMRELLRESDDETN